MPARKHVHDEAGEVQIAPAPSLIDLAPCGHRIPPMLAVRSPCLRATIPTQGQICTETQCRYARRERYRGIPSTDDNSHRLHGSPRAFPRRLVRWDYAQIASAAASLRFGRRACVPAASAARGSSAHEEPEASHGPSTRAKHRRESIHRYFGMGSRLPRMLVIICHLQQRPSNPYPPGVSW